MRDSSPMSDRVTVHHRDGVADVRLNRPEKMNALDGAMFDGLVEAGEALKADPARARGGALGGGPCVLRRPRLRLVPGDGGRRATIDRIGDVDPGRIEVGASPTAASRRAYVWQEMPAPVIAAVHGVALGGGFQIALGADIRIVAPDAQHVGARGPLGPHPRHDRHPAPAPASSASTWPRSSRSPAAWSTGEEAVRLGLATRVSETPLDDALALAREIAGKSPQAVRGAKALLNLAGDVSLAEASRPRSARSARSSAARTRSRPSRPTSRSVTPSSWTDRDSVERGGGGAAPCSDRQQWSWDHPFRAGLVWSARFNPLARRGGVAAGHEAGLAPRRRGIPSPRCCNGSRDPPCRVAACALTGLT